MADTNVNADATGKVELLENTVITKVNVILERQQWDFSQWRQ